MRVLLAVLAWFLLLALSWPLALLALVLAPVLLFLAVPMVLLVLVVKAAFALLKAGPPRVKAPPTVAV